MSTTLPKDSQKRKAIKKILLKWGPVDNLETVYVNQAAITGTGSEYYLVFGETSFPVIVSDDGLPEQITIVPKVRLAIGLEAMKAIVRLIRDNVHLKEEERE